ncbi:MAG: tetratricopeptide repeat protein [Planctomycetota bacterium]
MFGFAVADGLAPVVGAAPYDVLSRQMPRQLVQLLNGGLDRGVRFLPYLTTVDGQRSFLRVRQMLPVATLASLHQRGEVQLLIDGMIEAERIQLRIHDGATQRTLAEHAVPFAPQRPLEALQRLWFEVTTALGWNERLQQPPMPSGPTLSWLLVAKDQLLSLEANVAVDPGADVLRAARECAAGSDLQVVHEIVLESAAFLLRAGSRREQVAELLRRFAESTRDVRALRRAAGLLQAVGDERTAAAAWTEVVAADPQPDHVEACAGLWFRLGEIERAGGVLRGARRRGALGPAGLGQLAAVADRLGDRALRDELIDQLTDVPELPPAVARLVGSFLFERERVPEARRLLETCLQQHPKDAGVWLDLGRACLLLDDRNAAAAALQQAGSLGDQSECKRDIERLLRLSNVPGLFAAMRRVDVLLARGEPRQALREARVLVRGCKHAAEAWLFLGVVRHKLRQERRAETALRRALQIDGELAEAHNRLGILLVARGAVACGHDHLVRAGELAPNDPSPRLHLAQACALLGRRGEGERHLRDAEQLGANPQTLAAIRKQFFAA